MEVANGTFEVKITPQADEHNTDPMLGRMLIDKQFRGDLEGTSHGQMLSAGTPAKGSAGYVAMEKFSGSLKGMDGTFVLQHSATVDKGTPHLLIGVVPDSGTGALSGISGSLEIIREEGKHLYKFTYNTQG